MAISHQRFSSSSSGSRGSCASMRWRWANTGPLQSHTKSRMVHGCYVRQFMFNTSLCRLTILVRNNLPPALEAWLINPSSWTIARDLESLAISLGTQGTFFAIDNNGPMWGNLPPDMDAILQAKRDPTTGAFLPNEDPQHVTFGFNQAWIYINSAGKGNWDLRGQNSQLNDFLNKTPSLSDKVCFHIPLPIPLCGTIACRVCAWGLTSYPVSLSRQLPSRHFRTDDRHRRMPIACI